MIKTIFFVALIPAVLLKNSQQHLLSFDIFPEERAVPICTPAVNGTSYCMNCVASEFCIIKNGFPSPIQITCSGSTPVCGFDGSVYACIASNANCQCPGTPGLSYLADPFNSHFYTTCSGTNTIRMDCGMNYYDPQSHSCTTTPPAPPVPPCPGAGVFEDSDPTTCDGYIICTSSTDTGITDKCVPPKSYFNPVIRECDYPVPSFRCQAGYLGYYADPFDCKRYYFCNGINLLLVDCCPGVEVFDSTTGECSTSVTCLALPQCARATTTTPAPTTSTPSSSTSSTTTPSSTSSTTTPSTTSSTTTPSTTSSTTTPSSTSSTTTSTSTSSTTPSTSTSSTTTSTSTSSATPSTSTSSTTPTSTSLTTTPTPSSTTSSTTTTTLNPGCTPQSSFTCPAPTGFYAQCNYCARTYFQCTSGTATLRTCSGNLLFNTVPTYPACLSTCPYYP